MKRTMTTVVSVAGAFAIGTALGGWWTVPLLALVAGYMLGRDRAPGLSSAIGASLAWGGILLSYRVGGLPIDVLTRRLAGAMQLPTVGLIVLAVTFPALLAGAAGALGGLMRGEKAARPSPAA